MPSDREDHAVELVAIWLYGAARDAGCLETVRRLMQRAMHDAAGLYDPPDETSTIEDLDNSAGVIPALVRFTAQWDQCEREEHFGATGEGDVES